MIHENKKYVKYTLSLLWIGFSLLRGTLFIRKNYGVFEENNNTISIEQQIFWLLIAMVVAILLIAIFIKALTNAIYDDGLEKCVFKYALPFFAVLLSYFLASYMNAEYETYYYGDELRVLESAFNLYPYYFIFLSEIYLICFFIIPCYLAPTIVKICIEALIMGYVVYRVKNHYKTNMAYLLYIICLLKPFYVLGVEVHRMQWYGFIYLYVMVKLYFDIKEKYLMNPVASVYIILLVGLLSVFRREGVYLVVLGPLLLILAYGNSHKKRVIILITFFIIELVLNIPIMINGVNEKRMAQDAIVVHMLGEKSLNRGKVKEELEVLSKVYDFDKIEANNQDFGIRSFDMNYFDIPGWYDDKYYIIKEDSKVSSESYQKAFESLIIKEPIPFIKSRLRAFGAAGRGDGSYNLFFSLLLLLYEIIYSVKNKEKGLFVILGGVLIHVSLTTLAMPASFFKYYFEMWLISYIFIAVIIVEKISKSEHNEN